MAVLSSLMKQVGTVCSRPSSFNNLCIHLSSRRASDIDLYSTSADEYDIVFWFLVLQQMGDPPNITTKTLSERRINGQADQSESQYIDNMRSGLDRNKIPCPKTPF